MPIDRQKLNAINNNLKELVGSRGSFVLYVRRENEEGLEDTQIRSQGTDTKRMGLMNDCHPFLLKLLTKSWEEALKKLSPEPD